MDIVEAFDICAIENIHKVVNFFFTVEARNDFAFIFKHFPVLFESFRIYNQRHEGGRGKDVDI